jgi:hypothetical protein
MLPSRPQSNLRVSVGVVWALERVGMNCGSSGNLDEE